MRHFLSGLAPATFVLSSLLFGCGSSDTTTTDDAGAGGSASGTGGSGGAQAGSGGAGSGGAAGAGGHGVGGGSGASAGGHAGGSGGVGGVGGSSGTSGAAGAAGASGAGGVGGAAGGAGKGGTNTAGSGGSAGCPGADTSSDPLNCGACGNACDAGSLCCDATCVTTTSCAFSVTSIEPNTGWLCGGQYFTVKGHGFKKGLRVSLGDGVAPTLALDDTTARIQSPPGLTGVRDLVVRQDGATATRKAAFTYMARGIDTTWTKVPLSSARADVPGLAMLQDGRVLIAGGASVSNEPTTTLTTADLFDPTTMAATLVNSAMSSPRWEASAVTMLNGEVLVVGGGCNPIDYPTHCPPNGQVLGTKADLFDPQTLTFTESKSNPGVERVVTKAVLLADGRVFILSAFNTGNVEIYDPSTDTFTVVHHDVVHTGGFVVRLRDGRILLGGGNNGLTAAEIWDPATETFHSVGPMVVGRSLASTQTLPDGRVVSAGGNTTDWASSTGRTDTIEFFDPATETFSLASLTMSSPRQRQAGALLADGSVFEMGGYTLEGSFTPSSTVDRVTFSPDAIAPFSDLLDATSEWSALTGNDGSIIGVGGGAYTTGIAPPFLYLLLGKE